MAKGTVREFLGVRPTSVNYCTCHEDGSVTYWCPLRHQWIESAKTVPIHALTCLTAAEEARVRRHLSHHGVFP